MLLKKLTVFLFAALCLACASVPRPKDGFVYKEVEAGVFVLALWQKISDESGVYKFYIEGDGYAFDSRGRVSRDPTPKSGFVRYMAFNDPSPNVIYLGRPCQFVKNAFCENKYWSGARFSQEVIDAQYEAVKNIAGKSPVILIGYSGGAMVAGLIAAAKEGLNVKEIITVAGNLDHKAWTENKKLPPLNASINLADYKEKFFTVKQTHYAGEKDNVVPPQITKEFLNGRVPLIIVPGAGHAKGFEDIYPLIWQKQ